MYKFEKDFPLPWSIKTRNDYYGQGYGEIFHYLNVGPKIIQFSDTSCDESIFLSLLKYLTASANLMPRALNLIECALTQEEKYCKSCEEDKTKCDQCFHKINMNDMNDFLSTFSKHLK